MQPEFTAYQEGPHARVACVAVPHRPRRAVVRASRSCRARASCSPSRSRPTPTPIPSPVENLRPARDTCEQCHWPEKFTGDRVRQVREYAEDEANTETTTTLQLHVGSGSDSTGAHGIHWHMAPSTKVTYITTDPKRQKIVWVEVADRNGVRDVQGRGGDRRAAGDRASGARWTAWTATTVPSHRFDSTPERAVNEAIAARPDPEDAAVRAARGRGGAEDGLRVAGGGGVGHRGTAHRVLRPAARPRGGREEDGHREGRRGHSGHLPPATSSRR